MSEQIISCPECSAEIPLNTVLTEKIQAELRKEMNAELQEKKAELAKKEADFAKQEEDLQKTIEARIAKEREEIAKQAKDEAAKTLDLQLKDLQKANEEKDQELKNMKEAELELRKQKREVEAREKNMQLELERKLDTEREKIALDAKKAAAEESRLKIAEKDKQMEQLKKALEDAKRKSEQGSMQIQGDVQEDDLKIQLQNLFPVDTVEDVPTGIKGADLVQRVRTELGREAGMILWESKNTKAWSAGWIKKLKDDQALVKADVCILVSQSLPDGIEDFGYVDGVWVCKYTSAASLAAVLRANILQLSQVKQSLVGKDQKMELLYNYLSGSEFRNRIENIVSAFTGMQSDLETEKRSMQRIWKKREKEIERVVMNTSGMYGDLQGLIGASLQTINALELPAGDEEDEDSDE